MTAARFTRLGIESTGGAGPHFGIWSGSAGATYTDIEISLEGTGGARGIVESSTGGTSRYRGLTVEAVGESDDVVAMYVGTDATVDVADASISATTSHPTSMTCTGVHVEYGTLRLTDSTVTAAGCDLDFGVHTSGDVALVDVETRASGGQWGYGLLVDTTSASVDRVTANGTGSTTGIGIGFVEATIIVRGSTVGGSTASIKDLNPPGGVLLSAARVIDSVMHNVTVGLGGTCSGVFDIALQPYTCA